MLSKKEKKSLDDLMEDNILLTRKEKKCIILLRKYPFMEFIAELGPLNILLTFIFFAVSAVVTHSFVDGLIPTIVGLIAMIIWSIFTGVCRSIYIRAYGADPIGS